MYDFIRTDEAQLRSINSVQTIINGINLDRELKGFRTLAVKGREENQASIQKHDKKNYITSANPILDGSIFLGSNLKDKEIDITYQVSANSYQEQTRLYEMLNYYIKKNNAKLIFTDDIDFYYIGSFKGMDRIDISLEHKGELSFSILDPYKYSNELYTIDYENTASIDKLMYYPAAIDYISIKPKLDTDKLVFKNESNGQRIIINHDLKTTNTVKIYFNKYLIELDGKEDISDKMEITSDYEDFIINSQDKLSANIETSGTIAFRERRL